MPTFYTSDILLINQSEEIGEKQFSVFDSRGGQNSPLMHIPLYKIRYSPFLSLKASITTAADDNLFDMLLHFCGK